MVAGALGGDTRVVIVHETPSPSGSVPIMPGWDIQLLEPAEVSPRSLEGWWAAETLEIQMGQKYVSETIRPLLGEGVGPFDSSRP